MNFRKALLIPSICACLLAVFLNLTMFDQAQGNTPSSAPSTSGNASGNVTWTAETSNPNTLGWMKGSPPPANRIIRFDDGTYFQFPQVRWTVCNFQQLMPTKAVSRRLAPTVALERALLPDINQVTFLPIGSRTPMTWEQSLSANFTDGIVVLHRGKVVYEKFDGCLTNANSHAAMSMTKSFVGLLAELLVAEGTLQENKLVKEYIPELAESAFGDATVRQVMDMTTALDFSEDYADPDADIYQHGAAGNPLPKPADYVGPRTYFESLQTVRKQGEHGRAFGYKTVNTDALGWLIARVSRASLSDVLSEKIWSKIGAEQDGFFTVDSIGTPFAGGGYNAGLMDMARFGQMMLDNGKFNGQQVVPESAIRSIRGGGDRRAFTAAGYSLLPGWSYRSMWWVTHNNNGAYMARGVHGQALYIDPKAQMVIARFCSFPTASNSGLDPTSLPAYQAIADYLTKQDQA